MPTSSTSIQATVSRILTPHNVDSDTCEYIASMWEDRDCNDDEEARQAVVALVSGSIDEDDHAEQVCRVLLEQLDLLSKARSNQDNDSPQKLQQVASSSLRKLSQAVTIKTKDVSSTSSNTSDAKIAHMGESSLSQSVASFYANMIDISNNTAAQSERQRRKHRQRELRERMEAEERQRAVQEAMDMLLLMDTDNNAQDQVEWTEESSGSGGTVHTDVHLVKFDLPNLRGDGPDLLQNASLTLARGRRYGLLGVNGCGKSTLLTFLATRQIPDAVSLQTSMLLVRQEIIGNEWTAVETVLKSDVKRESLRRFIAYCEGQIQKLEDGDVGNDTGAVTTAKATKEENSSSSSSSNQSKGRQKLRDRKRQTMQQAARTNAAASLSNTNMEESVDARKTKLNVKLIRAYERMAQMEEEEGGDPEPRARKVLAGLGFSEEMQDKPTQQLSGGWRMRVSISCALFASPSLLLLDEPTNHLDLEAVLWLEKYLTTKYNGTLVVVSHDRHFLNEVVTDVVHFHRSKLTTYRGDISSFQAVRDDDKQRQIRLREIQEAKRAHLQKYIDLHAQSGENGPKAARQRKSKMKKLDKLGVMAQDGKKWKASYDGDAQEVEEYVEDDVIELKFPCPGSFDGDIVRLEQVRFGYSPDNVLFEDVDLSISLKSRVALLGRNGTGKSSLIKLVVGALHPLKGRAVISPKAKIEYLAQHQLEQLDPDGTPLQTMLDRYPGDRSNAHIGELRRYLANFGLGGEILPIQKIHTMSGGQKCRVCLAAAMFRKPHLLILDEPTNHLDLETTEALIEALRVFEGGVLLVSHDQHLLTSVCEELIVVEKGRIERLTYGNSNKDAFNEYKRAVVLGRR